MKKAFPINLIVGLFIVICYVTCTTLAFIRFPLPYSPFNNWLSDLGNPDVNPTGAGFYNAGIVLAGLALMFFFLRLTKWRITGNRIQRIMTLLTTWFGCVGSLAMIMTAIHAINQPSQHSFWSMILYISFGTAFAFSAAAMRYYRHYPQWLFIFGVIVTAVDMVAQIFFTDVPISEWFVVPLLLGYCLLLATGTERLTHTYLANEK
jgi:hypothetical membrane protein